MQLHRMKYIWWEDSTSTAVPSSSASDVMGQRNKIGGFIFRAAFVYIRKI